MSGMEGIGHGFGAYCQLSSYQNVHTIPSELTLLSAFQLFHAAVTFSRLRFLCRLRMSCLEQTLAFQRCDSSVFTSGDADLHPRQI